tara:strand:- start:201 stop:347 length:147 start_codon:yes stop_codon:yes gene_type:complete
MNEAVLDYDDMIEEDEKSLRELLIEHEKGNVLFESTLETIESITATIE